MPTFIVDTEAAELMGIAVEMLQAALTARTRRADPDKIISDSLTLQANKLKVALAQLSQPDPPDWSATDGPLRARAISLMAAIIDKPTDPKTDDRWRQLRRIAITPGFAPGTPSRPLEIPDVQAPDHQ